LAQNDSTAAEAVALRDYDPAYDGFGSFSTDPAIFAHWSDVRFDPRATKMLRCREVTQSANNRLTQRTK
jgi:hypothetical protein